MCVVNMNNACVINFINACVYEQDLSGDIEQKEAIAFDVVRDGKVHNTHSVCVCVPHANTHIHHTVSYFFLGL